MIVNSTELQNNFGKFLRLSVKEDIMITRNGKVIARLSGYSEPVPEPVHDYMTIMKEQAADYNNGRKASFEEFLELAGQEEVSDVPYRYEYIDGEIYVLSSPKTPHQRTLTELLVFFYNWFQGNECTPIVAPYDIKLRRHATDVNIVQPDLMIICDLDEQLGEDGYYQGVPTLIVEILSKSTRSKDMIKKTDLYMSCGVQEYWMISTDNREVTVYQFDDHKISAHTTFKNNETAQSYSFSGLTVPLDQIFR